MACLDFHRYGDILASGSLDTNIKVMIAPISIICNGGLVVNDTLLFISSLHKGGGKIIVGALELFSLKFHFSGGTKAKGASAPPVSPDKKLELMILNFFVTSCGMLEGKVVCILIKDTVSLSMLYSSVLTGNGLCPEAATIQLE